MSLLEESGKTGTQKYEHKSNLGELILDLQLRNVISVDL